MSFNITKVTYPRTLMFGETYDFSKITAETDSNITIDHIDATWLGTQPPFSEMGYHPLQITATASNGETATTTVEVFAYEKPHDGFGKFMIVKYKGSTNLLSYDCTNNPDENKLYLYKDMYIRHFTSEGCYIGTQGYTFNETTKQWDYNKNFTGYDDFTLRMSSFYINEILYSNADFYAEDQTTLIYPADPLKKLKQWDTDIVGRKVMEYTDPREYDPTIEAYYVFCGAYNTSSIGVFAYGFRNLEGEKAQVYIQGAKSSRTQWSYDGDKVERILLRYRSGKWSASLAWRQLNTYSSALTTIADKDYRYATFMNGLQEQFNVEFTMLDASGNYARSVARIEPELPVEPEVPGTDEVKQGRYRMKEEDGTYSVLHLETNREMVIGLNDKLSEIDALIENQYNKAQTIALFDEVDEEIQAMEQVAEGLNQRLEVAESDIQSFTAALEQEVSRATQEETRLQEQLNGLDFDLDVIHHAETGILAQSKDYTNEEVAKLKDGAIKDLEGALAGNVADLDEQLNHLTQTVASDKAEADIKLSQLDTHLTNTESRVVILQGAAVELSEEDARLATEIERLNTHLSNKGSDTLVFQTREEFEQAPLSPKVGDLIYILEEKRAYIFTQDNEFVVFDEITNHLDLVSYSKKDEVTTLFEGAESRLTAEVERAQLAEQQLSHQIADLSDVVGAHSIDIEGLETTVQAHEIEIDGLEDSRYTQDEIDRLIDEAIALQAPHLSDEAPMLEGLKEGHVWLDTTIE